MAVTNTVMVGRLGALPLAVAGLGGMLYFTGCVMLQGVLSAVAPLAAYALGAGNPTRRVAVAGAERICGERCDRGQHALLHDADGEIEHAAEPCGGERQRAEPPDHHRIGHGHRHVREIGGSKRCR